MAVRALILDYPTTKKKATGLSAKAKVKTKAPPPAGRLHSQPVGKHGHGTHPSAHAIEEVKTFTPWIPTILYQIVSLLQRHTEIVRMPTAPTRPMELWMTTLCLTRRQVILKRLHVNHEPKEESACGQRLVGRDACY